MRPSRTRGAGIFALLIAATSGVACAGGPAEVASGEVVLYTSMPEAVVDRLEGVIELRFPDLEGNFWVPLEIDKTSLRVVRGRTADIERLIAEEVAGSGLQADMIWLAEPSPYETYKDIGLLAPYEPPQDAPIPSHLIDPDGFYAAGRIISMVVAWNTSLWPGGLDDWPDLHSVESAAFPGPESGAARATIMALMAEYGEAFFATFAERGGTSVASNGAARDGVAAGTFEAAAMLDYMAREAKASGSAIDFAYPASGTVVIPSPIAITATARNPRAAKAVVDFILSQSGQQIMVEIGDFYPVRTDVAPPAGAPPLDSITALDIDWSALVGEIDAIGDYWEGLFGPSAGTG